MSWSEFNSVCVSRAEVDGDYMLNCGFAVQDCGLESSHTVFLFAIFLSSAGGDA